MSKKNEAYPVVLITGAAKRIGAELARLFSTNGFTCIIHYNTSKHEADELAKSLNEKRFDSCFTIQGDLNTESTVTKIGNPWQGITSQHTSRKVRGDNVLALPQRVNGKISTLMTLSGTLLS